MCFLCSHFWSNRRQQISLGCFNSLHLMGKYSIYCGFDGFSVIILLSIFKVYFYKHIS